MLTKENFSESHIRMLQKQSKKDPALLERAVFAFGLLEAIRRVEMPFIFKGGTCLILLLKQDFDLVYDTYCKVAAEEISYRGNNITVGDAIKAEHLMSFQ